MALGKHTAHLFDRLDHAFHSAAHRRFLANGLVAAFLLALGAIELASRGLLGDALHRALPRNHFHAVELAFYLLLSFEVAGLVFAIARSVSNAAGKQFEIFSLILLRQSFEAFAGLDEPVRWAQAQAVVWSTVADAIAALLMFLALGYFYRFQKHRPLSADLADRDTFIVAKKMVSLALLVIFLVLSVRSLGGLLLRFESVPFFEPFYTVLVFADVIVVLISLRYNSSYDVVFRNSALAVATVLLRLGLSAPAPWNGALGLTAVLFALGLTLAFNRVAPELKGKKQT